MGGSGSGRWYRWNAKDTVEGCKAINVNWLRRNGYLKPAHWFTLTWTRNGEPCGWITAQTNSDASQVTFTYRSRTGGGPWEDVNQPTAIEWTPCRYGGQRPWFRCPGRGCIRRVVKLYAGGKYFLCRRCYDLAYQSQREDWGGRALLKQHLGGHPKPASCGHLKTGQSE
jgi:hypothetical protein